MAHRFPEDFGNLDDVDDDGAPPEWLKWQGVPAWQRVPRRRSRARAQSAPVRVRTSICARAGEHAYTRVRSHARMRACLHARTHARTHARADARTHERTLAHMIRRMHARTHEFMHAWTHAGASACTWGRTRARLHVTMDAHAYVHTQACPRLCVEACVRTLVHAHAAHSRRRRATSQCWKEAVGALWRIACLYDTPTRTGCILRKLIMTLSL